MPSTTGPLPAAGIEPFFGAGADVSLTWHPSNPLEARIDASYGHKPQGPRWVQTSADNTAVFGFQDPELFSITLREQIVLTPRLTFQLYAQPFSDAEQYAPFYMALRSTEMASRCRT